MEEQNQMIDSTTRKAAILLFALVLVFIWFKYPRDGANPIDVSFASASETLVIPKLKINAPIKYVDSHDEDEIQQGLYDGVVHIKGTAVPGEKGNVYIVGHSSNYSNSPGEYNKIFETLPEMEVCDDILIQRDQAKSLVYQVVDKKVVSPDNVNVLDQNTMSRKLLTLQTSYPIGSAKMRYLIVAELK